MVSDTGGDLSKLRLRISMSLDGYIAGPEQSKKDPLGIGGEGLHEWVFPLAAWRAPHGLEGGEVNESSQVMEEELANIGATIMGRNMFGGHPGPWSSAQPWNGWWGDEPPFHHPVFVLTHHARPPLALKGGTTFTFVTDGIAAALELARRAAGGRDVALAGGASAAQQYLSAGLVDEMEIHLVPTLLGGGERLFDGVRDLKGLRLVRTVAAPGVTHLKFSCS
jgi:dihydrofolate reductase